MMFQIDQIFEENYESTETAPAFQNKGMMMTQESTFDHKQKLQITIKNEEDNLKQVLENLFTSEVEKVKAAVRFK